MPRRTFVAFTSLAALLAAAACEPPGGPAASGGAGSAGDGADAGGGSGGDGGAPGPTPVGGGGAPAGGGDGETGGDGAGGGDTGDGVSTIGLTLERRGAPPGVSGVDLQFVGIALFTGAPPTYVNADTPCSAGREGALAEVRRTVPLDLTTPGRTPLASLEVPAGPDLRELWLVLLGDLRRGGRTYEIHASGEHLCVMPDGEQYVLVRVMPGAVPTRGGADRTLVIPFDARQQIVTARVDCGETPGVEECAGPDDADDDGDADTRLRFTFQRSFPVAVEPAP